MDADAVLAEFAARYPPSPMKPQHKQQQQQFGGRRLDEKPVASAATADTDAAMKWMEERLDALTTADPPISARQRPTPRATPAATSDFSALAQLEAEVRKLSATLRGERERAASLRAQLAHSGVDDDALPPVTAAAAPPPPAPPASIAVRNPRRGKASVAATGASELAEAASKRAGLLRRQLPSARAELEAVTRECEQLAERLRAAGISVHSRGPSPVDLADGLQQQEQPPQRPHPEALLAQLRRLDRALREAPSSSARNRAGGIHGLATTSGPTTTIPLTVFSDGFMLYRGPFRPFGKVDADLFARQVMAGHLPNELRMRHAEGGVAFDLHDKTTLTHAAAHQAAVVNNNRRPTGGAKVSGMTDLSRGADALLQPQSADQLLQRLPASVLNADGNVMSVRAELAEMLGRGGSSSGGSASSTPPPDEVEQKLKAMREARLRRFG